MNPSCPNRFEEFFADRTYVGLKNHLYNYRLRRQAISRYLGVEGEGYLLEVGSGLSPMVTGSRRAVYSDLSFSALKVLHKAQPRGLFVVADATALPFKTASFSQVVCSEVLEHLPDDREALRQMAQVLQPAGELLLTFPHRHCYFACDDRYVHHYRRYERDEMEAMLNGVGLQSLDTERCWDRRKNS